MIIFRPGDFVEYTNPYNNHPDYVGMVFEVVCNVNENIVSCKNTSGNIWDFLKETLRIVKSPLSLKAAVKCECGSEITGSNRHSSWCPKGNMHE